MKAIKITNNEENVFFSSDFHWKHGSKGGAAMDFIVRARGFNTSDEHCKHIENLIDSVPENSDLVYAGDVALNASEEEVGWLMDKMNKKFRKIYMVFGNHDQKPKKLSIQTERFCNFEFLGHYAELEINCRNIVLCHYPIADWNGKARGSWHIHGHCHMGLKSSHPNFLENKILDIGIDYKKTFWTFLGIKDVMNKKGNNSIGHH